MKRVVSFFRGETVLSVAWILAIVSCFFVFPDRKYADYIDVRTLVILFCLMAVMAGYKEIGVFDWIARKLLGFADTLTSMMFILVMLCFFFSMFITNDVALITFVPLTLIVLNILGEEYQKKWTIKIVVLQTIAANLGSMLTPIGNPQNLYLYGVSKMNMVSFLKLMLPYSLAAFVGLIVWIVVLTVRKKETLSVELSQSKTMDIKKMSIYSFMFIVSLLTVARVVPFWMTLILVIVGAFVSDVRVLKNVDYSLLLTFVGFFVFIGNMGRIDVFHQFIQHVLEKKEIAVSILASQFISNVPAALLLSGFTKHVSYLVVGTNLGGLGTLIASMASLISFKYVARENKRLRGMYLLYFTVVNVVFLAGELGVAFICEM